MTAVHPAPVRDEARLEVRKAWFAMLLLPVAFGLSFLIGEGVISLLGYPVGGEAAPPLWAMVTAVVPALLVWLVPPWVSMHFARQAARHGRRDGWVPVWLLLGAAVLFALLNLVAALVG